jgi:hypothetical protein
VRGPEIQRAAISFSIASIAGRNRSIGTTSYSNAIANNELHHNTYSSRAEWRRSRRARPERDAET